MERKREFNYREAEARTVQLKAATEKMKSDLEMASMTLMTNAKCQKLHLESKLLQLEAAGKLVKARMELRTAGALQAGRD